MLRRVIGKEDESVIDPSPIPMLSNPVEEDIPRYPPFMKGLPATSPDRLLETQWELIGQIQESGLASREIFDQYYLSPLRSLASYVHLLPASESHHHRGAGGLFRHAVEVALWSLQLGDRVLLPGDQTPRRRREIEPRWHVAVFLSALCHDIGKPITDLKVTSQDGEKSWNPFAEDLYSWASANAVDHYFLHWRPNRGRDHTSVSILLAERIIGRNTMGWIYGGDPELVLWMTESIACQPSQTNMIHNLVVRSDQVSVARDMETLGSVFAGYDIGVPVERMLLDIMRRLVRESTWTVNVPGSRLWFMEGHLYLVWPIAGEEMAAVINREKLPGLPRTPNSILDMLTERKLAEIKGDGSGEGRYWQIAPAPLTEKIPHIRLTAIRISKPSTVLDQLPVPIAGRLVDDKASAIPNQDQNPSEELNVLPNQVPNNPVAPVTKAVSVPTECSSMNTGASFPEDELGVLLKGIAEDFRAGRRDRKKLTYLDETGVLCLKWPDIIKDRGMESRAVLDYLGSREWLVVDPMQPFRRVTEVRVGIGAPWKVIRVQPVLRELLGISSESIKKLPGVQKAAAETKAIVTEEISPKLAIMQIAETEDANAKRLIEKKMKLLDEVISVLIETVRGKSVDAIEEEGGLLIAVSDVEAILKNRVKVSRAQILGLQRLNPQRFNTVERNRIVYFRLTNTP
ncbi:MobH family relaxase [Sulfuritalea hydrogenivorans]|uniref:Relaxase n=1 Tax=Sulfuritalea hydrogenivorans sk43H TaxID=1223802 RepID=W0SEM0_9PROT|nr:MobH family relaxase [Sulfuritalea hydrogenivorans]BAO29684.1 relaxase [Sulfuritalea hydrogenivorans sk43H]